MIRPRILQLISGLDIGTRTGGAEAFACKISSILSQQGFEINVFALNRFGSEQESYWIQLLEGKSIPVIGLVQPSSSYLKDFPKILKSLKRVVRSFQPHILHSHSERTDLLNILAKNGSPHLSAVRTVHIDQQWQTHPLFGRLFNQVAAPLLFSAETAVSTAVQEKLDQRWLARTYKKKSILCYNGIDESLLTIDRNTRLRDNYRNVADSKGVFRLGIVGRLNEQKGHSYLLDALKLLPEQIPFHLSIVGDGPYEAKLRALAQENSLTEKVTFLGNRKDVLNLMADFDLLVSSSLWEGFPTVILEAMAIGIPVLATDVSGSRELIKDRLTGRLVSPGSAESLASGIRWVYEHHQESRAMASEAQRSISPYTIQNAAEQLGLLYRSILSEELLTT